MVLGPERIQWIFCFFHFFHSTCFFSFPFQLAGNLNEDAKLEAGIDFFRVPLLFFFNLSSYNFLALVFYRVFRVNPNPNSNFRVPEMSGIDF